MLYSEFHMQKISCTCNYRHTTTTRVSVYISRHIIRVFGFNPESVYCIHC